MAVRIAEVRVLLHAALVERKVRDPAERTDSGPDHQPWGHILKQRGMFSFTGIPASVVNALKDTYHIYMLTDGRISCAGLNPSNIPYFADSLRTLMGTKEEPLAV